MIHNFENTESWEDTAGNTKVTQQQVGIAPLNFRAPFLCIHHQ